MKKIFIPLLGLLAGILIGTRFPLEIPASVSKYVALAALAALDTVVGGAKAGMQSRFDYKIFLSGFLINGLVAASIAYMGDKLGVELYMAAIVAFGVRIFQNVSTLRILIIEGRKEK
ncbi:small basic family protein [Clostridia bacterium]|nr:small basic family protein [Clostridia bacterium]